MSLIALSALRYGSSRSYFFKVLKEVSLPPKRDRERYPQSLERWLRSSGSGLRTPAPHSHPAHTPRVSWPSSAPRRRPGSDTNHTATQLFLCFHPSTSTTPASYLPSLQSCPKPMAASYVWLKSHCPAQDLVNYRCSINGS